MRRIGALLAAALFLSAAGCGKYGKPVRSATYRSPPPATSPSPAAPAEAGDDEDSEKRAE
jgi:hypothetical protein